VFVKKADTMKKNLGIKASLYINYFVFAILLNSVGIVIAKSINVFGVSESGASVLEAFKDLPIAIVSFFVASFLPRFGYKRAMLVALSIVFVGCVLMVYGNSFLYTKVLFLCVGVGFALVKISVYSLIGVLTNSKSEHSALMSRIEGVFMIGIALAYFLFPFFYSDVDQDSWLDVYYVLAGLIAVSFLFLLFSKVEYKVETAGITLKEEIKNSLSLLVIPLVLSFIVSAFLFVMIEQGIMTWLPRFNEKIFKFSDVLSVQMASVLAISLAIGRFLAGYLSKKIHWAYLVIGCVFISCTILLLVLYQLSDVTSSVVAIKSLSDIPFLGFVLPLLGVFIAPIYPLLNSIVLSSLPKRLHAPMTGLIIIFSALGGTLGSRLVGELFYKVGGVNAFYGLLIPMILLIVSVLLIDKLSKKKL